MERRRSFWTAFGCYFFIGTIWCVDIAFENSLDGYFLRSPYNKYKAYDPNLEKETFLITNTEESPLIQASFGPFEVYQSVPSVLLSGAQSNRTKASHHAIMYNMDVSIHVVSWPTGPDQRNLRVLIHASALRDNRRTAALFDYTASKDPNQQWCARVFLQHGMYELSTVCVFSEQKKACVAEISVPVEWWTSNVTSVNILYSVTRVDEGYQCASASNFILPDRTSDTSRKLEKIFFTKMSLSVPVQSYQEKKDQFILLYVPTKTFLSGAKFDVPVKLEAEANLQVFTIKVKARSGIKIVSAEISSKSRWTINVDINTKQRSAVVKAYVKDKSQYTKTPWVQDIFRWRFEVDQDIPADSQSARLIWNIKYETSSEKSALAPSRIVSYITVNAAQVQLSVVPVLKVNEVINTAVLTGKHQVYPLGVYAVSQNRTVVKITDATLCYSSNEAVLKVSTDCRNVYVDGSETAGSSNVSVIAKYGEYTVYHQVAVWVPESRLDIQLSDNKLSQVKEWRAPHHARSRRGSGLPPSMRGKDGGKDEGYGRCSLRYQQAMLEVYTRLTVPGEDTPLFYGNSKAYFRVTELVKDRIRVSDPRIAKLGTDIVIQGKQPGRTEIQVLSPAGRVIAAKEVRVGKDKVQLEPLLVTMVTGISLEIKESKHVSGALTATAHIHDQLQGKYSEGVLNVMLKFSDGTVFPLKYVQPEDYHLDVVALNHHIVGISPYMTPHQPRVKALAQGRGKYLKVLLRIGDACHKKKSHPLSVAFAYISIDMNLEKDYMERYQNDGGFHNRASDRWHAKVSREQLKQNTGGRAGNSDVVLLPKNRANRTKITADDDFQLYHPHDDLAKMLGRSDGLQTSPEPRTQAQLQSVPISKAMTPLEIGMYVLLAIFCLAIIVFVINCVIFVFRYRRKQVPKVNKDLVTNANDWVWIGRATLERNAVKTRSPHALMRHSDFNGNHERESSPLQGECESGESSSAPNSNRNSTASTYKGSECSIRITNNPFDQAESDVPNDPYSQHSGSLKTGQAGREPEWDYEAMGMTYEQLMEYFDNLKESTA